MHKYGELILLKDRMRVHGYDNQYFKVLSVRELYNDSEKVFKNDYELLVRHYKGHYKFYIKSSDVLPKEETLYLGDEVICVNPRLLAKDDINDKVSHFKDKKCIVQAAQKIDGNKGMCYCVRFEDQYGRRQSRWFPRESLELFKSAKQIKKESKVCITSEIPF